MPAPVVTEGQIPMTSADNASIALRTSRDQSGRDAELETAQASYLRWDIDRVDDEDSPEHGRLRARRDGYTATAPDLGTLRRCIIERETGRGLTGEARLRA